MYKWQYACVFYKGQKAALHSAENIVYYMVLGMQTGHMRHYVICQELSLMFPQKLTKCSVFFFGGFFSLHLIWFQAGPNTVMPLAISLSVLTSQKGMSLCSRFGEWLDCSAYQHHMTITMQRGSSSKEQCRTSYPNKVPDVASSGLCGQVTTCDLTILSSILCMLTM